MAIENAEGYSSKYCMHEGTAWRLAERYRHSSAHRAAERIGGGGAGQIQKVGLHKVVCVRRRMGHAARKF